MAHKVGNGAIIGIVSEDGIAASKRVTLVDRSNMKIVNYTQSDEFGAYVFNGLNPESDSYIVFAVDDEGSPKKAALIFDYVKPIPAHQGGLFYSNWYYVAMQKEPIIMLIGSSDTLTGEKQTPLGVYGTLPKLIGSSIVELPVPVTKGAANIGALAFKQGFWGATATGVRESLNLTTGSAVACEIVIDTSVPSSFAAHLLISFVDMNTAAPPYSTTFITIEYIAETGVIKLLQNNGASWSASGSITSNMIVACSYTIPEELKGTAIHVVGNILYGNKASLFVNGALVDENPNIGSYKSLIVEKSAKNIIGFVGSKSKTTGESITSYNQADFTGSVCCFYKGILTASEVSAHYSTILLDQLPLITGYAKAVYEDYPSVFLRLNDESNSSYITDSLRPFSINQESRFLKINGPNINRAPEMSVVAGGGGSVFSGGAIYRDMNQPFPSNRDAITVEFFAKNDSNAVYKTIMHSRKSETRTNFQIGVLSTGEFVIDLSLLADSESRVLFTTKLDAGSVRHYAFVVDRVLSNIKVYVDAVLVEVVATVGTSRFPPISVLNPTAYSLYRLSIGAQMQPDGNALFSYTGFLAEFAIYNTALTQAKITAHYEARLVI